MRNNPVVWLVIVISRYFKDGDQRATDTFGAVLSTQVCGFEPNRENFVRLLCGAAGLRAVIQGRVIHGYEARPGVCCTDGVFETKLLDKCVHSAAPNHVNIVFMMDDKLVRLNATLSDIALNTKQRSGEALVVLIVAEWRLELAKNHIFSYSKDGFMIVYSMYQVEATLVNIFCGNSKYDFFAWGLRFWTGEYLLLFEQMARILFYAPHDTIWFPNFTLARQSSNGFTSLVASHLLLTYELGQGDKIASNHGKEGNGSEADRDYVVLIMIQVCLVQYNKTADGDGGLFADEYYRFAFWQLLFLCIWLDPSDPFTFF